MRNLPSSSWRFRTALSTAARHAVARPPITRLLNRRHRRPRILMYHGIGTAAFAEPRFRLQMMWLNRLFRVLPLADAVADPGDQPRPALALTFDDGLRNNFTSAYPILRELRLPATFFVCPGLADSGHWLWTHECRARLARLEPDRLQHLIQAWGDGGSGSSPRAPASIEAVMLRLKALGARRRTDAIEELRQATAGFSPTLTESQAYDVMSWMELRALDPALISIGSHTMSHALLPGLDPDALEHEVSESRRRLEHQLGRAVEQFCFPNGEADAAVLACVGRHYALAVTTRAGWVTSPLNPIEVPRIPAPADLALLAWRLQRPTA